MPCLPLLLRTLVLAALLSACGAPAPTRQVAADCRDDAACADTPAAALQAARLLSQRALRRPREHDALGDWSRCAALAHRALAADDANLAGEAAILGTHCTDRFLAAALSRRGVRWPAGAARIGKTDLAIEHRGLSPHLTDDLSLVRARDVSMAILEGQRFASPGFGVPVAVLTPRCADAPACRLQPPEGVFRWATVWFEAPDDPSAPPRLVIADPLATGPLQVAGRRIPLALDTSAHYAHGAGTSALPRLGVSGLLGGREVGRRAGVYVLGDYDPDKPPLVMLHGLGSNPLIWARLSNAVWGDARLREHFQIWHVVYQTEAPLLVTRMRVQGYLDQAWQLLDPEGDDPARQGMVLVGHSMGGVVSRLLCVDAGDTLWNAAFTVPPEQLPGAAADREGILATFRFRPYPGVTRAVFIAAPHRGSPTADGFLGRLTRFLVGRRVHEVQALRRLASEYPEAVKEEVRESYRLAALNSIATLQRAQPVRRAGETLMPVPGIPHHSIAGALPGREPKTDGTVPLESTVLPTAESSLVIATGHDVYRHDAAIAEVLRVLHLELAGAETVAAQGEAGVGPAESE
jgi:pimeloyl-ACP methyl ester carboxylesterase